MDTQRRTPERARRNERGAASARTLVVVTALVSLAVGGLAGGALGWKIEQNRVKSEAKDDRPGATDTTARKRTGFDVRNIRPVGTVSAIEDRSVTIDLLTGKGKRTFRFLPSTVFETAAAGARSDVAVGSKVLVRTRGTGKEAVALEVIVLAPSTTFGGG